MLPLDHIGIAVKNLKLAVPIYEKILDSPCYKTAFVESENLTTAFFKAGQAKIELLESNTEDGVIARFIAKKGEGIHHIAFEVADITAEIKRLQQEGFTLLNDQPKMGADNKWICFLHPKDTHGVLIELCQSATTAPAAADKANL